MKQRTLRLLAAALLLVVNSGYYWEAVIGAFMMPIMLLLLVGYVVLLAACVVQLVRLVQERFASRERILTVAILITVLTLTWLRPAGMINFDRLSGDDLLVATRGGVANCSTTLRLKDDGAFRRREVCFEITITDGQYEVRHDTIFFRPSRFSREDFPYRFGVVRRIAGHQAEDLLLYRNAQDSTGLRMGIGQLDRQRLGLHGPAPTMTAAP